MLVVLGPCLKRFNRAGQTFSGLMKTVQLRLGGQTLLVEIGKPRVVHERINDCTQHISSVDPGAERTGDEFECSSDRCSCRGKPGIDEGIGTYACRLLFDDDKERNDEKGQTRNLALAASGRLGSII